MSKWLNKITEFEDTLFIKNYAYKNDLSIEDSEIVFHEMKKFLVVCSNEYKLTPSRHIDKMWHEYILDTKNYELFNNELGKFVHHIPMNEFDVDGYNRAIDKLLLTFGEVNKDIWPEVKSKSSGCCYGECSMGPIV